MRQGQVVQLEIPGAPEYVAVARHAVEGIARRMDFDAEQIEDLKLAVGEACTNAVRHGCPGSEELSIVEIRCIVKPDGLMVEIRNNIDHCPLPKVPAVPDTTKECGFGLFLIRRVMDEVDLSWESKTATVRMLKRLRPAV